MNELTAFVILGFALPVLSMLLFIARIDGTLRDAPPPKEHHWKGFA